MPRELIHLTTIIKKEDIGKVNALDLDKLLGEHYKDGGDEASWKVEEMAQSSTVVDDSIYITTTLTVFVRKSSGNGVGYNS